LWLKTSGRSDLDLAARRLAADLADDADERVRALVGHVVAVDRRDHRVPEAHARDLAGDAGGFQRVVPGRLAGLDVAEAAAARARVAEDHEGGGAALPAVADVRAGRLLAHRVQVVVGDLRLELAVLRPAGHGDLEPLRLALADVEHVGPEDLEHVHPTGVRARAGLVLAGGLRRRFGGHRRT
jgi:hypothetical protein